MSIMSRIEKVSLKCEALSMKVRGSINIPEVAIHGRSYLPSTEEVSSETPSVSSPAFSDDSGRGTSKYWPSSKYFVFGGPGFSIGILDSVTGSLERLPIPVPTPLSREATDAGSFSLSEVTCLTLAGESQVWAGTETGSLHVFGLDTQRGLRLKNHGYSKLPYPISCLRAEQLAQGSEGSHRTRTELLVGSVNNTLTIISGEADERGGLRNVIKCPRKLIHLGSGGGESSDGVHCITLVTPITGITEQSYWCGCGPNIVILKRSNWKILNTLGRSNGLSCEVGKGESFVSHLEATDYGVWCTMSQSPTMMLWDTKEFSPKLKISCFNPGPESPRYESAQVTCLVYCDPLLLVGTQGGDLLVISIHRKQRSRNRHNSLPEAAFHSLPSSPHYFHRTRGGGGGRRLEHTVLTSTHCYNRPITNIHPITVQGGIAGSPFPASPSSSVNMLILFGKEEEEEEEEEGEDGGDAVESIVHLYEIVSSPLTSPMSSPQTATGRLSTASTQSLPTTSLQKCSLQDLTAMPNLTLTRVSNGAISYLPLHENSAW